MDKLFFCCPCDTTGVLGNSSIIRGKSLKIPRHTSISEYFTRSLANGTLLGKSPSLIRDGLVNYTFTQLDERSTRLAKAMKSELDKYEWSCSNEDGDLVIAFCLGNTEMMIAILFAILKLGATYLPLDPQTPEENLVRIVAAVRPILIVTESHEPIVARFECVAHVVNIVTLGVLSERARKIPDDLNDVVQLESEQRSWERTAAIYFTSGTSGRRKGVRMSHEGILNRIMWQWDAIPYKEDDIACLLTQTVIHTSIPDIFAPLLNGTPLVIWNRVSAPKPDFLINNIADEKVTRLTLSSAVLSSIIEEIEKAEDPSFLTDKLVGVRCWTCCGDMLTKDLCRRFFQNCTKPSATDASESEDHFLSIVGGKHIPPIPKLVHIYGTTETTADATYEVFYNEADVDDRSSWMDYQPPFGIPIANTIVYILGDGQKVLPLETKGEICVSGRCLAKGYIASDVQGKFLPNHLAKSKDFAVVFRTGDLGRIAEDSDGELRLYYEGRCGAVIKVGGKIVDSNTLSTQIRKTGLVDDVDIFVYHHEKEDQIIVAAAILKHDVIAADLTQALKDTGVERICIPEIYPVSSFPVLMDGRMDRHKLAKNYKASRNISTTNDWNALNLTPLEIEAGKILCEVVALSIGVSLRHVISNFSDSYWDLGGNSSNVILTVSRLRAKDYHLTLENFILAKSLPDVLDLMLESQRNLKPSIGIEVCEETKNKYSVVALQEIHKEDVIAILCQSYLERSTFAMFTKATQGDFRDFLTEIWKDILSRNLSIIIKSKERNEIIAVCLNVDANAKPSTKKTPASIKYTLDLFDQCERNAKARFTRHTGKLIQPYMIGTSKSMSPGENSLLVQLLLEETISLGLKHSFTNLLITSDSAIMRQMCRNIFKCDILLDFPISAFVAWDNTKPFNLAGSYYSVMVYSKGLKTIVK